MYPATIFEYVDQSAVTTLPIADVATKPMFMVAFTSDKGPEKYTRVSGSEFFKLYGEDISFTRHGQPLLQAARIINAGGELFAKRVVADDSTLANAEIVAEVATVNTQKTNSDGEPLYDNGTAEGTTETQDAEGNGYPALTVTTAKIKYLVYSAESAKTIDEAIATINTTLSTETPPEGSTRYPLFIIADNGRGEGKKRFRIEPDYTSAKSSDYMKYNFKDLEGNETLESIQFAFNPDQTENGANISMASMVKKNSKQITIQQFDSKMLEFANAVASIVGMDISDFMNTDILFGLSKKGENNIGVVIDIDEASGGVNLAHNYGIPLSQGTNGAFGSAPMESDQYSVQMVKAFDGTYDVCIYDLDNYKIDCVVDANYPDEVKRAIENFVAFREDCMYFADMGLGNTTIDAIKFKMQNYMKSKFIAVYCTTYDVVDPYSKKQIPVTMTYTLAELLVNHFNNGRSRPLAGILNGFILNDAVEGTINLIPVITPTVNQKEQMEEIRVNYAAYYDNVLVVESLYTTQEKLTQFSYVSNILAIQQVIKSVRTLCPKIRYSFMDGEDLEKYKKDVQGELDKFSSNFMSLTLEYTQDAVMISNKIFYASIKVQFRNFVQTEWFKVIALPS